MTTPGSTPDPGASATPPASTAPLPGSGSAPPPAPGPWDPQGLTPENRAVLDGAKWTDLNAAFHSYDELRKLAGKGGENLVRVPTDPSDKAGWHKLWSRTGWPEKPDGYDFGELKLEGGDAPISLDDYKAWAHELGMSNTQARQIAERFIARAVSVNAESEAQKAAAREAGYKTLQKEWGTHWERNFDAARRAAEAFGLKEGDLEKLVDAWGYQRAVNHLYTLGMRMLEHSAERGGSPLPSTGAFGMTEEQAIARIRERMADNDFVHRLEIMDPVAKKEISDLHRIAYPGPVR